MANEFSMWQSIVEVAEADGSTGGSTGIKGITGKPNPMRRNGDPGADTSRPIITHLFPTAEFRFGTKDALRITSQFNCLVENDSTGQAEALADRLEAIMTNTNMNSTARTTPVDVIPYPRARREFTEQDKGRRTVVLEVEWWFNR